MRAVWHSALEHHVIAKGLSVPSPYPISGDRYHAASSFDIESRTVHATRFHKNFTSEHPGPKVRHAVKIQCVSVVPDDPDMLERPDRVSEVEFLNTASGHQYLVAVVGAYNDRVACWEISPDGGSAYSVAQWPSRHSIRRIRVNELSECLEHDSPEGLLAVACEDEPGTLEVVILGLDRFRGCFLNMGTIEVGVASWLHFFRGCLLGLSEQPQVIHWQDGSFFRLQKKNSVDVTDWETTVEMKVLDDNLLLMITHTTIELFLIPTNQAPFSLVSIHCVGCFDLPPRVIALSTAVTGYNLQTNDNRMSALKPRRQPLSVLVRPVDGGFSVIHHFVFELEPLLPDGSPPAIPLRFPPTHVRTIPTLPSCSTVYLSPSGRGCWLETRNVGSKTHSYPARCVVPLYVTSVSTQQIAPDIPEEWQVDLKVGKSNLYERPCGWKDLIEGRQRISSVAFDDGMGRIAVGDIDGGIVILNYV